MMKHLQQRTVAYERLHLSSRRKRCSAMNCKTVAERNAIGITIVRKASREREMEASNTAQ
jgi:hypothetical protein